MSTKDQEPHIADFAAAVATELDADLLLYSGSLESPYDRELIDLCGEKADRRPNAYLILVTYGGSAHAAYSIARCLQRTYERLFACVPGPCGSAGTLLVVGAHELISQILSNVVDGRGQAAFS